MADLFAEHNLNFTIRKVTFAVRKKMKRGGRLRATASFSKNGVCHTLKNYWAQVSFYSCELHSTYAFSGSAFLYCDGDNSSPYCAGFGNIDFIKGQVCQRHQRFFPRCERFAIQKIRHCLAQRIPEIFHCFLGLDIR